MTKLHEVLAAEKTPQGAWNEMQASTLKKFKNTAHYFEGHTKKLNMIAESDENAGIEAQAREEKPVTTTVYETLEYALGIWGKSEDLQFQKNKANQSASGTVMWNGEPLLVDMPIDQLLGLEARLTSIRKMYESIPTLDATRDWKAADNIGKGVWEVQHPETTTKTEKQMIPVEMSPSTKEHPAQVKESTKDVVVGTFTTTKRSGSITAIQKANAMKMLDSLIVEIKQARMRANENEVSNEKVSKVLVDLLLSPFN